MVWVVRGGKNTAMHGPTRVQALKMPAVVGYHSPAKSVGAGQDVGVGCLLAAIFLGGQHVMAKPAQCFNDGIGKVFIGVELHSRCQVERLPGFWRAK